jgi:hypothetical protein
MFLAFVVPSGGYAILDPGTDPPLPVRCEETIRFMDNRHLLPFIRYVHDVPIYTRQWSVNTVDGACAAVSRYEIEGHAKPFIRGKSGMFVALLFVQKYQTHVILQERCLVAKRNVVLMETSCMLLVVMYLPGVGAYD